MFGHVVRYPVRLFARVELEHVEIQIRSVESRHHDERVAQSQQIDDVTAHAFGRRRRERGHRGAVWQRVDELADRQVRRAEILTPLRHAMRLVDGEQRDISMCGECAEPCRLQPLGGDVQQLHLTGIGGVEHLLLLVRGLRGVDECGRYADLVRTVHLVAHQRDQRGDHNGDAMQQQRGNLVADRFAGARGHHAEHVAPFENGVDELRLAGAEALIAEVLAQCGECGTLFMLVRHSVPV